ncbi:MAG: ThuA domain-containing protein [Anaerolineaceae bacterium]|nr:ThuA domain-containing protein [Anaerolineaceae bacterium]
MSSLPRVTVWNEYRHEKSHEEVASIYPDGIHGAIAEGLREKGLTVHTATLDEPENGLTEEVLDNTDVLTWWGHMAHGDVDDKTVERVHERVLAGKLGLIVLHSGHFSKIFKKLMGTTCNLKWREIGEKSRIWVVEKSHPIAKDLPDYFELEHEEMYGEHFGIPAPDELVFISWFQGGEVFRSGCCYRRGNGKIFYFQPGHETYPNYYNPVVRQVIYNAVLWAKPEFQSPPLYGHFPEPIEKI